jgi:hypothetical protein
LKNIIIELFSFQFEDWRLLARSWFYSSIRIWVVGDLCSSRSCRCCCRRQERVCSWWRGRVRARAREIENAGNIVATDANKRTWRRGGGGGGEERVGSHCPLALLQWS